MTNILKGLKLTATRPDNKPVSDPLANAKLNVIRYLKEQRDAATAEIDGKPYSPKKTKKVDGVEVSSDKRFRKGWFQQDGKTYFYVKYGLKPLELAKDMVSIEVGTLKDLPALASKLIEAVEGGELDAAIKAGTEARKGGRRKAA